METLSGGLLNKHGLHDGSINPSRKCVHVAPRLKAYFRLLSSGFSPSMPDSGASAHEADISEVLRQDVVGEGYPSGETQYRHCKASPPKHGVDGLGQLRTARLVDAASGPGQLGIEDDTVTTTNVSTQIYSSPS